jgi:drug/metabolite transporter (DMT)-like permease
MQLFYIFYIVLLKEDRMKRSVLICIVLSVIFVAVALFSYFYESKSTGLLPVITYPLRDYTVVFAIIGAVLASCGIFIQKRRENR